MEGLTQISSLSPTQENSESAYEQFMLQRANDYHSTADAPEKVDDLDHAPTSDYDSLLPKHHSAITDSTARTYREDDTGHVYFDEFVPEEHPLGDKSPETDPVSQDASYAPRVEDFSYRESYEPQTPAAPVNPFSNKGSVLKAHEMFGATQSSSIGRHIASVTSSRPSPDVYNDFTSPPKRILSSPLARHVRVDETTPLQSSARTTLRSRSMDSPHGTTSTRVSGVQSFDVGPRIQLQSAAREQLPYISMKESQERRMKETSRSSPDSETESDSDIDDIQRKRQQRRRREQEIRKQLSIVELHKNPKTSRRPRSSSPDVVEVPSSTGRRRSIDEDYIAQCEGRDARDTQQDDIIADSQGDTQRLEQTEAAVVSKDVVPSWTGSVGTADSNVPPSSSLRPHKHETDSEPVPDLDSNTNSEQNSSPPNGPASPLQQQNLPPSLPLNEVSTNRTDLRTPMASKDQVFSDGADVTVPETSPSGDRIRPMGEIANISFAENNSDEAQDYPGFTQDTEFENAIQPRSSHPTPKRTRAKRNPFPAFAPPAAESEFPRVSNEQPEVPAADEPSTSAATISEERVNDSVEAVLSTSSVMVVVHSSLQSVADYTETGRANEDGPENQDGDDADHIPQGSGKRDGLRSKENLKGPSRELRRSGQAVTPKTYITPRQASRVSKKSSTSTVSPARSAILNSAASSDLSVPPSPISIPEGLAMLPSMRKESPIPSARRRGRPPKAKVDIEQEPSPAPAKRSLKRKSSFADEPHLTKRSSKRQLASHPGRDSPDPLAMTNLPSIAVRQQKRAGGLFNKMAFAVSYVNQFQEKNVVIALITEQGGQILEDGFDGLFEPTSFSKSRTNSADDVELTLSPVASRIGFAALIADEHSRKEKYMQALALSLPCISGRWISACVSKGEILDWGPYLLCAGQSSFLGNAIRSRTLQPYPAVDANFPETFSNRKKFLNGKSILLVTGKGRAEDKRKAYIFLTRVLGPSRIDHVPDLEQARKKLLDSAEQTWDLLYVDGNEQHAETVVFGQTPTTSVGSRKRKKGPVPASEKPIPEEKRIRIISDEVMIQSLILGQLLIE